MEIRKSIFLTADELAEALTEYLSKRNVAYEVEDIDVYADENGVLTGVQVVGN